MAPDPTDSFSYLIGYLGRLYVRALERRIQPHGLHPGQFPTLLALWKNEGVSQAELCRVVQVEQPTMANTLNRMERDGLIRRDPDPVDRRRMLIYLTDRAHALKEKVARLAEESNDAAMDGLTTGEQRELKRLLRRMIGNLEQDGLGEREITLRAAADD